MHGLAVLGAVGLALVGLGAFNVAAGRPMVAPREELLLAIHVIGTLACLARAVWVREERRVWVAAALGAAAWTAAWSDFAVTGGVPDVTTVGLADVLWASAYPGWFAAAWFIARTRIGPRGLASWLDGMIGAMAAAALTAATVLEAVHDDRGWSLPSLFFPLMDTLLIGLLATTLAGAGWRLSRSGSFFGLGMCLLVITDSIHAVTSATVGYQPRPYEALWALGILSLGVAAWTPNRRPQVRRGETRLNLVFPCTFAGVALAALVAAALLDLNHAVVALAAIALLLVLARLVVTLRETAALAESRRLALTDEVTGAGNRRALLVAAKEAVERGEPFALLMLDLDRFKELNDTLGHQAGDEALRLIARRLARLVEPGDAVGRLGGDEFGLVLAGAGLERAEAVAEGIGRVLSEPLQLDGLSVSASASVGIALHPDHASDVTGLLRRADVAMYEAKRAKSSHRVYASDRDLHSRDRLELAGELGPAIERGELILRYQPVASFATDAVTSCEALVRWLHPVRGELAPGAFLPAVEHTPLMRRLTAYVLDRALADAAQWPADRGVAVNVSPEDVLDAAFADAVAERLERHGLEPNRLTLEVTETTVLADPARASVTLGRLRRLGVRVALDDFGTGYSSLTHLQRMPVDVVKIDRSFVDALGSDRAARAIVRSTVVLAHALGATVVAEGAETERTVALARSNGCDAVQGYALARPLVLADVAAACDEIAAGLRRSHGPRRNAAVSAPRRPVDAAPARRTSRSV